ncbi:peroxisomal membrane 22 kda family protein [Citrus sinensis]|uniref:Peroxisomal membrane 22 kDa family protein n=1 Tax=Citrus sinensis TaxID=2711 RepID=A0ACB8KMR2_CITSI|nr:peroxisomal membrane 22 kda family protein [Citrus sinensis]
MAVYGMLILGPSQHYWFNFLSRILPKRDALTTLKKIFMGQAIYGPLTTTIFFSYNAALQGETTGEIVARLKRDLLPTMGRNLVYWPICDFITFKFIPVHLQPLVNSSFAYVWTIYLTYKASLNLIVDVKVLFSLNKIRDLGILHHLTGTDSALALNVDNRAMVNQIGNILLGLNSVLYLLQK